MYKGFELATVPLKDILLDLNNPRIISTQPIETQEDVLEFLFEHEKLTAFIKDIAQQGKNPAAERPYIYKQGKRYVVGEGNTRIAAYKILSGLLEAPSQWAADIPKLPDAEKKALLTVDVSIAPSNERLAPIKARLHFGLGEKASWGWLSSRQEISAEWARLKNVSAVAKIFNKTNTEIQGYLLEFAIYKEALKLSWTDAETSILRQPRLEFNPPIRFLETKGHKEKIGITLDKTNLKVTFADAVAKRRFKHLIKKLVIHRTSGIGATASFDEVFADFNEPSAKNAAPKSSGGESTSGGSPFSGSPDTPGGTAPKSGSGKHPGSSSGSSGEKKTGRLFDYKATVQNTLLEQLMAEAALLDCRKFPGAGTILLRCIVEALAKHIIQEKTLDPDGKVDDLSGALALLRKSPSSPISKEEKKVISEFEKQDLQYLNLVIHANVRPNFARLETAVSVIDMFIRNRV